MFKVRSWKQVALLTFVFLFTFFFGLELGVLICLSISLILVVKHTTLPRVLHLGITPDGKLRDLDEHPEADQTPGTLYLVLEDALYFANIGQVKTLVTEFVEEGQKELAEIQLQDTGAVHVSHYTIAPGKQLRLVLEFQRSVDLTALHALEEMLEELMHRGAELHLIGLSRETKEGLNRSGLMKHIPDEHIYERKRQFLRKFMTIQVPRQAVFDTYQQAV
jgi:MFS superfamily sulfate permease-like transporter